MEFMDAFRLSFVVFIDKCEILLNAVQEKMKRKVEMEPFFTFEGEQSETFHF